MNKTEVKIIADTIFNRNRVTTFEITLPHIIVPEFLTHRMFSRNAASFRAIPTSKFLKNVQFTPTKFPKNRAGMSSEEWLEGAREIAANCIWAFGKVSAKVCTYALSKLGVHKQIANRPVGPYSYTTYVVTSNEFGFNNFFEQRCDRNAQPEMYELALYMRSKWYESTPQTYPFHIPYSPYSEPGFTNFCEDRREKGGHEWPYDLVRKIATARLARISYLNHGSEVIDYEKDLKLFESLVEKRHMSPFDHILEYDQNWTKGIYPNWFSYRDEVFAQYQER